MNFAKLALFFVLASSSVAKALPDIDAKTLSSDEKKYFTIGKVTVQEIKSEVSDHSYQQLDLPFNTGAPISQVNPVDNAGKVIQVARDLVALGEDIYRLVVKGKPTNTTKYAPISVIPKVNNQPVDLMETENWKMPVKRSFKASWKNLYGVEVVGLTYSVFYSYGGSYDGRGRYLTAVQIIPEQVSTLWGYDFTATMKLGGIQNNGTRANPVAAATILLEYTVSTILKAENRVDTFHVTGAGSFKKY